MPVGSRRLRGPEPLHVDAGVRNDDPLLVGSLEHQAPTCSVGRREEEIAVRERDAALPAPPERPERVPERNRLPDRQHEPVAETLSELGGLSREPDAQLGAVDDVGAAKSVLEPEVAIADAESCEIAESPPGELLGALLECEGSERY